VGTLAASAVATGTIYRHLNPVGEQAQEMQLANWISTTPIKRLSNVLPAWIGLWFSVFPTVETLAAQSLAAILVIGSYFLARAHTTPPCQDEAAVILGHAPDCPMQTLGMGQNKPEKCANCRMKLVSETVNSGSREYFSPATGRNGE
jgi:hypothetical protein